MIRNTDRITYKKMHGRAIQSTSQSIIQQHIKDTCKFNAEVPEDGVGIRIEAPIVCVCLEMILCGLMDKRFVHGNSSRPLNKLIQRAYVINIRLNMIKRKKLNGNAFQLGTSIYKIQMYTHIMVRGNYQKTSNGKTKMPFILLMATLKK